MTALPGRVGDVALLAVGCTLGLALAVPAVGFFLLPLATAVVLAVAYRRGRWLAVVLAGAFLARLLALALDAQLGFVVVTGTTVENHQAFAAFAEGLTRGELVLSSNTRRAILGVLYLPFYLVLGGEYVVGALATAFYGTLLGLPVHHTVRQFGERRAALVATTAVLFWPSVLFRSLVVQRETVIVLTLFVLLFVAVRWVRTARARHLLLAVPALWVLFELRSENIVFVALLGGLVMLARGRVDATTATLLVAGVAVGVFFVLNFRQITNFGTSVSPAAIDMFAHGRAHGRAVYLEGLHYRSWLDILLSAPVKLVYFLFSPLPWQVERPVDLLAALSGWGVFGCCLLVPRAFRQYAGRRRELFVLVGYALAGATLYAIIEMNYGAAFRRRIAFVPVAVVLAACVASRLEPASAGRRTEAQATTGRLRK
jgi:hypothetical protein